MNTFTIRSFVVFKVVLSENSSCFMVHILQSFIEFVGSTWKAVLAYAVRSNGRAECMVGTIKSRILLLVQQAGLD